MLPEVEPCLGKRIFCPKMMSGAVLDLANLTSCLSPAPNTVGQTFPPQFKLPRTVHPGSRSLADVPLLPTLGQLLVAQQVVIDECEDFLRGDRFHVAFPVNTLLVN